jgi:hypothetical protein
MPAAALRLRRTARRESLCFREKALPRIKIYLKLYLNTTERKEK